MWFVILLFSMKHHICNFLALSLRISEMEHSGSVVDVGPDKDSLCT